MNSFPPVNSRRNFLKTIGAAGLAAPFLTPRKLMASTPAARVLRHASFGASGMAWADLQAICSNDFVKLVAIAEVDLGRAKQAREWFPGVKIYQDWRELLEKEKDNLDSVNVSTPDHMHAPIAMAAMQLGKHVYCQKPLAHDIYETRMLTEYARKKGVITQMGIQIHSEKVYRQAVAIVQSGVIGKVKEVHMWSNKKWGDVGAPPVANDPIPEGFNWDLWQGGAAERPFVGNEYYHPGNWRKRLDFGTGTFGDMGCHIYDPIFEALALTSPLSVRSEGPAPDAWNWATDARINYIFPGTAHTADSTVAVTWYDGDQLPATDIQDLVLEKDPAANPSAKSSKTSSNPNGLPEQGSIVIGTEGTLLIPHIDIPRLFPLAKFKDYKLPNLRGTHHWSQWAEACIGKGAPSANFDYAGPLTETVLLGSVAVRFPQTTLEWNTEALKFSNVAEANRFVRRTYRKGWEAKGL